LGEYIYTDIHHLSNCVYPDYLSAASTKPFYIPFRALTNRDFSNFLVESQT